MWCAMALAMMLPTAAPMIVPMRARRDRRREGRAGGFAAGAGRRLCRGLARLRGAADRAAGGARAPRAARSRDGDRKPAVRPGACSSAPALYQFSALKHACVTQCQRPFPLLLRQLGATRGVFRLGLRQGLYCLGCCWAMMLLMFAVGVMNVVWMAALGVVMTIEKLGATPRFSPRARRRLHRGRRCVHRRRVDRRIGRVQAG